MSFSTRLVVRSRRYRRRAVSDVSYASNAPTRGGSPIPNLNDSEDPSLTSEFPPGPPPSPAPSSSDGTGPSSTVVETPDSDRDSMSSDSPPGPPPSPSSSSGHGIGPSSTAAQAQGSNRDSTFSDAPSSLTLADDFDTDGFLPAAGVFAPPNSPASSDDDASPASPSTASQGLGGWVIVEYAPGSRPPRRTNRNQ